MPAKRSAMRKIKDVLRLKFEARLSHEKIAAATGMSKGAVTNTVQRAAEKGLSWPLPTDLDDSRLEAMLYRQAAPRREYAQPDYALMHQELKRNGVTLQLLWEEYTAAHGEHAYRYSQFCAHYHEYRRTLARSMRQIHRAGEKVFIDYSGDTVAVIDPKTGEVLTAEIFVATLGASKYAYAEATWTQTMPDWIGSTIRMLEFFGSVPMLWVPDNLKAAIKKACRYEPEATSTYEDCARHYGAAILPARPYQAKDKGSNDNIVKWTPRLKTAWDAAVAVRAQTLARPTNRRRPIPIRPEQRFIFISESGTPLTKAGLDNAWQDLIVAAIEKKIIAAEERFTLHGLKHRGITDTVGKKAEKKAASGHKSDAMLDLYDHEIAVVEPARSGEA